MRNSPGPAAVPIRPEEDMDLEVGVDPTLPVDLTVRLVKLQGSRFGLILVLRGVLGSGKSTLAKMIYQWCQANGLTCVVCQANIWFYDHDGTYHWDVGQLTNAHNHCHARFMLAMAMKTHVIVVDNANLHPEEYQWYFDWYDPDNFDLEVVEVDCVARADLAVDYPATLDFSLFQRFRVEGAIVVKPTFSRDDV